MLSASDAGRIGRLVLPKKCAEAYFPPIAHPEGLPLKVQDVKGKEWVFQFRFWPNNNSRMYVLEGITPCIQSMQLQAGDVVTFSRLDPEGKLVMGGRKALAMHLSDQGDEAIMMGSDASTPGDSGARNNYGDAISINGHMKEKILEDKLCHNKRKNGNIGAKNKRLKCENEDVIELKITWKEAQGLMRPPAKIAPSLFAVEGYEFEEFEETEPVIGRPTIPGVDRFGENIQWIQCEDCLKWRKLPADALLISKWTCADNVWDPNRASCLATEAVTKEQLDHMLLTLSEDSSKGEKITDADRDADLFVALEGLDTLAKLAIKDDEDAGPHTSSEDRTKHQRHKPFCTCTICLPHPCRNTSNHKESCECTYCISLRLRFKTLMERHEKQQLEKAEPSQLQQKPGKVHEEPMKSPLKGKIDLNIQPEREEESSPGSDHGPTNHILPATAGRFFRQPDLIGKQIQQDGIVGGAGFINCVTLDRSNQKTV